MMPRPSSGVPRGEQATQELILLEIISLLPVRATAAELLLRLADKAHRDEDDICDAINELKRFGVLRLSGTVLEPTLAAFHAAKLFGGLSLEEA